MRSVRPVALLLVILTVAGLLLGCGGATSSKTPLLESEKKLAGMYEACQNIQLIDGANKTTISAASLPSMATVEKQAVLKRSNGMTHTDTWKGTPLGSILDSKGVTGPFKELKVTAWDGYVGRVGYDIAVAPDTMLAYRVNGKAIPREDGPTRLVVPSQDGFYWIRMITKIEVMR
jgi:DMSO/TMAO reductase YedYZ molybdopterin-dependent catalytic subunit